MVIIAAIDVGITNIGLTFYDSVKDEFLSVENASLLTPISNNNTRLKYRESVSPYLINIFIQDRISLFEKCDLVCIENQMRRNMLMIQHSFASYLIAIGLNVRIIHPSSVRQYFNISCNDYKKNKKASVNFLPKLLTKKQYNQIGLEKFKKKDDVCESIIIVFYALKNIENIEKTIQVMENVNKRKNTFSSTSSCRRGRSRVKKSKTKKTNTKKHTRTATTTVSKAKSSSSKIKKIKK